MLQPKMGRGQYIKQGWDPKKNTWLVFSPKSEDGSGVLASILEIFKLNKVNLTHIESRSSQRLDGEYEFIVECDSDSNGYESQQTTNPNGKSRVVKFCCFLTACLWPLSRSSARPTTSTW